MSVRAQSPRFGCGTAGVDSGWKAQYARCSGVKGLGPVGAAAGAGVLLAGHGAPARTQSTSTAMSASLSFGRLLGICGAFGSRFTAWINRLSSGLPGTIAGPDSPPVNRPCSESTRRPPLAFSA